MTFNEFDTFMEELYKEILAMRATKGKVYANSEDRFSNFKRTAEKKGLKPLQVAGIFLDKHLDAIDNFIKEGQNNCDEPIRGRFKDAILYLFLMAGIEEEERRKKAIVTEDYMV